MTIDRYFELLLETKLQQPPLRSEVVIRDRLIDKLNTGMNRRLTLISAPAGYGKTSLVLSWIKYNHQPVIWISLDEQDNNPVRFFSYLAAAISHHQADHNGRLLERYQPPESYTAQDLVISIQNQLQNYSPFTLIVLDDYHTIIDQEIHRHLGYLIQKLTVPESDAILPERGCHFVITTRNDPPLPLSRWRLNGELSEIRTADLRFSLLEARQVIDRQRKVEITDKDLRMLLEKTEGWVASIQLASLILADIPVDAQSGVIHQLSGNHVFIADYLAEEVFKRLDPDTQSFLIRTSILDRISADLARAVTGQIDCKLRLETLEKSNNFVIPMDANREWFRYHPLFKEFLLSKLHEESQMKEKELFLKASDWYLSMDMVEDCLKCLLAENEFDRAAQVVIDTSPRILSRGHFYILRNILDAFPLEVIQTWPELCIYRGWANFIMNPDSVDIWLNLAEQGLIKKKAQHEITDEKENALIGEIAAIRALCASRQGDIQVMRKNSPLALELLPPDSLRIRGLVLNASGFSQYCDFQLDEAVSTYLSASELLIRGGNFGGAASESFQKAGDIRFIQGQLHEASRLYHMATDLEDSHSTSGSVVASCSHAALGLLAYEWNRVDEAFQLLDKGCSESRIMGITEQVTCDLAMVEILMEMRQFDQARLVLEPHFQQLPNRRPLFALDRLIRANWMRANIADGKIESGIGLLSESPNFLCNNPVEEKEAWIQTRSLYELERYQACWQASNLMIPRVEEGQRFGSMIRWLVLAAVSGWHLGLREESIASMCKALMYSTKEEYLRTYIDFSEPVLELLRAISSSNRPDCQKLDRTYLNKLLSSFDAVAQPDTRKRGDAAPEIVLTDQEKKVLRLILAGQNNREIANELCVSINTIKTHVGNIYEKLGVHNRFQASIRLQELKVKL